MIKSYRVNSWKLCDAIGVSREGVEWEIVTFECENDAPNPMQGQKHSEETKRLISEKAKARLAIYNPHKGKKLSRERVDQIVERNSKEWCFEKDGEVIKFKNLEKFSRENGLNPLMMSRVNAGKIRKHKGYKKHGS